MKIVLDAGALIAIDREDRRVIGSIRLAQRAGTDLVTTAPVVGQAWRNGARQARLARALTSIDIRNVDLDDAKAAGVLLARSGTSDVVDALVALLTQPGDQVYTSDPDDLAQLTKEHCTGVVIVPV